MGRVNKFAVAPFFGPGANQLRPKTEASYLTGDHFCARHVRNTAGAGGHRNVRKGRIDAFGADRFPPIR